MRKFVKHFVSALLILISGIVPVQAQLTTSWSDTEGCVYDDDVATFQGIECLMGNILGVAITLIGIGVFVMLVVGAYKVMASGGDPKSVEQGKSIITTAMIGLVIALASWSIIKLISAFTGSTSILEFSTQVKNN